MRPCVFIGEAAGRTSETMIFAAILAGGKGTRVGTDTPKQFLELAGRPVVLRTIDAFLDAGCVDAVYLCVNDAWTEHARLLVADAYGPEAAGTFRLVPGGGERMMSLLNVVRRIREEHGARGEDILLTHDAVRPFVTAEVICDCIEKTREHGSAMASIRSAETIYYMGREGFLTETYDRSRLWAAQTPHGCRMDVIANVMDSYTEEELLRMAGTSQLFMYRGIDVAVSKGDVNNIKITTMRDIEFAEYLFAGQEGRDDGR